MNRLAGDLLIKLESRTATTAVIGLGYVGLPLVVEFARAGFNAVGVDVDRSKVDAVSRGESVHSGRAGERHPVRASTPAVCVRRPTSRRFATLTRSISASRRRFERRRIRTCRTSSPRSSRSQSTCARVSSSSSNPRRIREPPTKWCSRCSRRTGSRRASDFFLAFSPERVDPGNAQWTTRTHPESRRRDRCRFDDRGRRALPPERGQDRCACRRRASPRW